MVSEEKLNWSVVLVVVLGTFMVILDGTIVNVGLPKMMAVFNTTPDYIQWVNTAYMLVLGIVMPVSGWLGDRFGYKRTYFAAMATFVLGSALCGVAWNVESMITARIIQALGGGVMQPLGMAILYRNYPREKMGTVMGVWGIAAMAAPAIGPTLGGYLVDYASWRLVFYINVPIGIIDLFLASVILRETPSTVGEFFDRRGLLLSSIGFVSLLLALSQASKNGWTSPYITILLLLSAFSLSWFVVNELRHPDPILDLRLFRNFTFTISVVVGSVISIGMFGVVFLFPLFMQAVLGQTAMQTGLIMFPAAFASGLIMPFSGRIFDRYGAKTIVIIGLAIVAWTTWVMGGFAALTPFAVMTFWLTMRGFGMGLCFMPVTTAGMNTVPPHLVGRASALNNVIRQVASAFGIAMFTTIMQTRQVFHFSNLASGINASSADYLGLQQFMGQAGIAMGVSSGAAQGMGIGMVAAKTAKMSMVMAIGDCFKIAAFLCLGAMFLAFLMKNKRTAAAPEQAPSSTPAAQLSLE